MENNTYYGVGTCNSFASLGSASPQPTMFRTAGMAADAATNRHFVMLIPSASTTNYLQRVLSLGRGDSNVYKEWFGFTANGNLILNGRENDQNLQILSLSETTTIAQAANTDTTFQVPAKSILLGWSIKVTVAPGGTTTMDIGDSTVSTSLASGVSTTLNTKASDTPNSNVAVATKIRFTPNTTPSDANGRVLVTAHYILVGEPT
jgi:hypothetical protein